MKRVFTGVVTAAAMTLAVGAQAEIVIATAGPMTGQYASFGEQMKRGAEMAVADINAKGGVLGQKLRLEIGDDACDPKQAVAVANQMVNKGVVFMAGHFCSGSSIPASNVYAEEGIVQISPASTNPTLTDRGLPNVFRTCGRDDDQGRVAGKYIKGTSEQLAHLAMHTFFTSGISVFGSDSAISQPFSGQFANFRRNFPVIRPAVSAVVSSPSPDSPVRRR